MEDDPLLALPAPPAYPPPVSETQPSAPPDTVPASDANVPDSVRDLTPEAVSDPSKATADSRTAPDRQSRGSTSSKGFKRSSSKSIQSKLAARKLEHEKEQEIDPEVAAAKARQLVMERRLLFSLTGTIGVAAILWLIAICTEYWFVVSAPTAEGIFMANYTRYFLYSRSGLFSICRYARKNGTNTVLSICRSHEMFPPEESYDNTILDEAIINYTRTELFFSVVSLIMMVMGFLFSIYTFRNPRYMFKRLAGGIHFLSAASVVVVLEVLINSIEYEKEYLHYVHPEGAYYYYHFSFYLAWVVFAMNAIGCIVFLMYSKKRKRDKALSEEMAMADEPTIIGR